MINLKTSRILYVNTINNLRPRLAASIRGVPPLVGESGLRRQAICIVLISGFVSNSFILSSILQLFAILLDRNLRSLTVMMMMMMTPAIGRPMRAKLSKICYMENFSQV